MASPLSGQASSPFTESDERFSLDWYLSTISDLVGTAVTPTATPRGAAAFPPASAPVARDSLYKKMVTVQRRLATDAATAEWSQHVDPSTGATFYYSRSTGKSRWSAPDVVMMAEGIPAAAPVVQSPPRRSPSRPRAAAMLTTFTAHSASGRALFRSDADGQWWSAHVDTATGSPFYRNENRGESSWSAPPGLVDAIGQRGAVAIVDRSAGLDEARYNANGAARQGFGPLLAGMPLFERARLAPRTLVDIAAEAELISGMPTARAIEWLTPANIAASSPAALDAVPLAARVALSATDPEAAELLAAQINLEAAESQRAGAAAVALLTPTVLRSLSARAVGAIPRDVRSAMSDDARIVIDRIEAIDLVAARRDVPRLSGAQLAALTPTVLLAMPSLVAKTIAALITEQTRRAGEGGYAINVATLSAAALDAMPLASRLRLPRSSALALASRLRQHGHAVRSLSPASAPLVTIAIAATIAPSALTYLPRASWAALSARVQEAMRAASAVASEAQRRETVRLSLPECRDMAPEVLAGLPAAVVAAIPSRSLAAVTPRFNELALREMSPAAFAALPVGAIAAIPAEALLCLSAAQIEALPSDRLASLPNAVVETLSRSVQDATFHSRAARELVSALARADDAELVRRIISAGRSGILSRAAFGRMMLSLCDNPLQLGMAEALAALFDGVQQGVTSRVTQSGGVRYNDAVRWFALRGKSVDTMARTVFDSYDADCDGQLSRAELTTLCTEFVRGGSCGASQLVATVDGALEAMETSCPVNFTSFRQWFARSCVELQREQALAAALNAPSVQQMRLALRRVGLVAATSAWVHASAPVSIAQFVRTPPFTVLDLNMSLKSMTSGLVQLYDCLDADGTGRQEGIPAASFLGALCAICCSPPTDIAPALRVVGLDTVSIGELQQVLQGTMTIARRERTDVLTAVGHARSLEVVAAHTAQLCFRETGTPSTDTLSVATLGMWLQATSGASAVPVRNERAAPVTTSAAPAAASSRALPPPGLQSAPTLNRSQAILTPAPPSLVASTEAKAQAKVEAKVEQKTEPTIDPQRAQAGSAPEPAADGTVTTMDDDDDLPPPTAEDATGDSSGKSEFVDLIDKEQPTSAKPAGEASAADNAPEDDAGRATTTKKKLKTKKRGSASKKRGSVSSTDGAKTDEVKKLKKLKKKKSATVSPEGAADEKVDAQTDDAPAEVFAGEGEDRPNAKKVKKAKRSSMKPATTEVTSDADAPPKKVKKKMKRKSSMKPKISSAKDSADGAAPPMKLKKKKKRSSSAVPTPSDSPSDAGDGPAFKPGPPKHSPGSKKMSFVGEALVDAAGDEAPPMKAKKKKKKSLPPPGAGEVAGAATSGGLGVVNEDEEEAPLAKKKKKKKKKMGPPAGEDQSAAPDEPWKQVRARFCSALRARYTSASVAYQKVRETV
jgi:hypothetical protein